MTKVKTNMIYASFGFKPNIISCSFIFKIIQENINKTISNIVSINSIIGGRMTYYSTLIDDLLREKKEN